MSKLQDFGYLPEKVSILLASVLWLISVSNSVLRICFEEGMSERNIGTNNNEAKNASLNIILITPL